jgi:Ferritin-like domain
VSLTRREIAVAVLGAAAVGASPATASGVDQLERLLALERGLQGAYRAALDHGVIDVALGRSLLLQEGEHVRGVGLALESLGRSRPDAGAARPVPASALRGRRGFARHALRLESEAVDEYVRVLATLDAPRLLQPLGSIMAAGAQHRVALRRLLDVPLLGR